MFELVFLGLASWFIPKFLGFEIWIIPLATGIIIGLISKGSLVRLLGALFALVISIAPAVYFAFLNEWIKIPLAVLLGGKLFAGYLVGTMIRLVFTPFRWIHSLFKK